MNCYCGWPVKASTEGCHEGSPVLVTESAVKYEIASRVQRDKKVENVAQSSKNGLFV